MTIRDTLISAEQAADFRARQDRHSVWAEQFKKPNGWIVITVDQQATCPVDAVISNEERGKLEQFEVWRNKPDKLFAYVEFYERQIGSRFSIIPRDGTPHVYDKATVSVWTGDVLGHGACNKVWRSNLGDKRASICVTIAGETYSGTAYLDSGTYCRLRRLKGRKS